MRDANFGWVFIGIESPDPKTLKETRKTQNTHEDVLASVRTIYSYGIDVLGGFIVGFDNDTLESFDGQYRFIMKSGIQAAMVGLLTALPRTPLYERLQREGRLREANDAADNTKLATNITPRHMDYRADDCGVSAVISPPGHRSRHRRAHTTQDALPRQASLRG